MITKYGAWLQPHPHVHTHIDAHTHTHKHAYRTMSSTDIAKEIIASISNFFVANSAADLQLNEEIAHVSTEQLKLCVYMNKLIVELF